MAYKAYKFIDEGDTNYLLNGMILFCWSLLGGTKTVLKGSMLPFSVAICKGP